MVEPEKGSREPPSFQNAAWTRNWGRQWGPPWGLSPSPVGSEAGSQDPGWCPETWRICCRGWKAGLRGCYHKAARATHKQPRPTSDRSEPAHRIAESHAHLPAGQTCSPVPPFLLTWLVAFVFRDPTCQTVGFICLLGKSLAGNPPHCTPPCRHFTGFCPPLSPLVGFVADGSAPGPQSRVCSQTPRLFPSTPARSEGRFFNIICF